MQLTIHLETGHSVIVNLQPGEETAVVDPRLPRMSMELLPDCQETDYNRRGDCDGRVRTYLVNPGHSVCGQIGGEGVYLCGSHVRWYSLRRALTAIV